MTGTRKPKRMRGLRADVRALLLALPLILAALTSHGARLDLSTAVALEPAASAPLLQDQIPHSEIAMGRGLISRAYLTSPTTRYAHGVLGDAIEAASLTVLLDDGRELRYQLPEGRVFEDLRPRLVNLDRVGADEIVVVESDARLGASLAVYGLREGAVEKMAATPFIGRPYRWLNPVGAGDFNGDSVMDLALVLTPHIGGVLQLYSYTPPDLAAYASVDGVSTHTIGSTALGMGTVVKGEGKDLILAPSQRHDELRLLEWIDGKIVDRARTVLPARMVGDLVPAGPGQWTFRLEDGSYRKITAAP